VPIATCAGPRRRRRTCRRCIGRWWREWWESENNLLFKYSNRNDKSEGTMLILQIQDLTLEKQLNELLQQKFDGNSEKMLQELVRTYTAQRNRSKYSGILKWEQDGLTFQKEIRREWQ
jgi:hypothetical protein